MAPPKRDAYHALNITKRAGAEMTCISQENHKRCHWKIPEEKRAHIHEILDMVQTCDPVNAIFSLPRLAQLTLCEDRHQDQAAEKIDEWKATIQFITPFYEMERDLKEENRNLEAMHEEQKTRVASLERVAKGLIKVRDSQGERLSKYEVDLQQAKSDHRREEILRQREEEKARNNAAIIRRMKSDYKKLEDETEERVRVLSAQLGDERQISAKLTKEQFEALEIQDDLFWEHSKRLRKITSEIHQQRKELKSKSLEINELDASETDLLARVFDLTYQLEFERHRIVTLESKLTDTEHDRNLALEKEGNLQSQLEVSEGKIVHLESSLREVEVARDMLFVEEERLRMKMNGEEKKSEQSEGELVRDQEESRSTCRSNEVIERLARLEAFVQEKETAESHTLKAIIKKKLGTRKSSGGRD